MTDPVRCSEWVQVKEGGKYRGEVYLEATFYPAIQQVRRHSSPYFVPSQANVAAISPSQIYSAVLRNSIRPVASRAFPPFFHLPFNPACPCSLIA